MSVNTSIHAILRHFAGRQNSAHINFAEFCEYMKRYAQHHLEEASELLPYITNTAETLDRELGKLETSNKILITSPETDRKAIIVLAYFIDKFSGRYREIIANPAIPFPGPIDLPKHITADTFEKKQSSEFIIELFEKKQFDDTALYSVSFPRELPIVLVPSSVSAETLLDISLAKIRLMLHKEEYHDYFLKKMQISNPGKELSAKNFFIQATTKPTDALEALKTSGDAFYYWNQLCYFIRHDYDKVKDYTVEDLALLQGIHITELCIAFYKNKVQQELQRTTALKNLELVLNKPPYYFDKDAIAKFVDSRGIPLLGQYTEQDLSEFLHTSTTTLDKDNLPSLLVFKLETEKRYFIYKNKVVPLIIRLSADARDTIRQVLTKDFFAAQKNFQATPAMKEQKPFEDRIGQLMRTSSPILYSLLHANFLALVDYENKHSVSEDGSNQEKISLFTNGKLIPYSELLLLSQKEILADAKLLLPFWYTIPFISWIASLFLKKPEKKQQRSIAAEAARREESLDADKKKNEQNSQKSRKDELKTAAQKVEKALVPAESTLERELNAYLHEWNKLLDKTSRANLTEDVNSLIRDYTRKILRTLHGSTFTAERIAGLADTLVKTPSMQKIGQSEKLAMYIQLYLLKIVKSL